MTPEELALLKNVLRHLNGVIRNLGGIYETITKYIALESAKEINHPNPFKVQPTLIQSPGPGTNVSLGKDKEAVTNGSLREVL